jgi:hypothetical protein
VIAAADDLDENLFEQPMLQRGCCKRDGITLADHKRCRRCGALSGTEHPERPLDERMHCGRCSVGRV